MEEEKGFNEDDACDAIRVLWLTMAEKFITMAVEARDVETTMKAAGAADKCYWLATGNITYD